jgi:hypothetical protein
MARVDKPEELRLKEPKLSSAVGRAVPRDPHVSVK